MKIKLLDNDKKCIPVKKRKGDAGFDLRASKDISVFPKDTEYVPTGVAVQLPHNHVGLLVPRSSMSKTPLRFPHSIGVIDENYTGEILCPIYNDSDIEIRDIDKYSRVAQLLIVPIADVELELVDRLEYTERNGEGFGSSGETL